MPGKYNAEDIDLDKLGQAVRQMYLDYGECPETELPARCLEGELEFRREVGRRAIKACGERSLRPSKPKRKGR